MLRSILEIVRRAKRLSLEQIAAVFVMAIFLGTSVWYCVLILTREIQPVLSTWLLALIAVALGLFTYLKSGKNRRDLLTNAMNTSDVISVGGIVGCILFVGDEVRLGFSLFDLVSFAGAGAILAYYFVFGHAKFANIAVNGLLVVGYVPLVVRLATAGHNTESFELWFLWYVGALVALYVAVRKKDALATLYAGRAVGCITIVLILMARIEFFA